MIRGLLFLCAMVAVVAFTAAYSLDSKTAKSGWKFRALAAAFIGGFLPILLFAIAFLISGDPRSRAVGVYLVLGGYGLLLSGLIGYPIAYLFLRRCERAREADVFK